MNYSGVGAGGGNRTHTLCLQHRSSAIKLRQRVRDSRPGIPFVLSEWIYCNPDRGSVLYHSQVQIECTNVCFPIPTELCHCSHGKFSARELDPLGSALQPEPPHLLDGMAAQERFERPRLLHHNSFQDCALMTSWVLCRMAAAVGIEPTIQESKSCALPFGHAAIWCSVMGSNHRLPIISRRH